MNIKNIAKQWLIAHEHYEHEPCFENDLSDLCNLIDQVLNYDGHIGYEPEYDSTFGDDEKCLCGHVYYRHFDSHDNMAPVGCKYCHHRGKYGDGNCSGFKLASIHKKDSYCKFL